MPEDIIVKLNKIIVLPEAISEVYVVNAPSVLTILQILMPSWQNLYSA
jgi:hypothetical protein